MLCCPLTIAAVFAQEISGAPVNSVADHVLSYSFVPSPELPTQIPDVGGVLQSYANVAANAVSTGIRMPYGGEVTLHLGHGRFELYGGSGGVFVPFATRYSRPGSWLSQTSFGARVALDPGHHFFLGATMYFLTDFAEKTKQGGYGGGDLTVRFGR